MGIFGHKGKSKKKERFFNGRSSAQETIADIFGVRKSDTKESARKPETSKHIYPEPRQSPLASLNPDQLYAAMLPLGRNLVIASAGTGKTSTITGRVARLIEAGIDSTEILLLTFTAKAADEMRERLEKMLGSKKVEGITTGTFHSVHQKLLKKLKPGFVLKLPAETSAVFKSVYGHRHFNVDEEIKPFAASTIYDAYGMFINTTGYAVQFSDWFRERYPDHPQSYIDIYEDVLFEFEELKRREKFYDFNDILLESLHFYLDGGVAGYKEIIVDEYQDTNGIQSMLVDAINPESLFCVGDYDQSIYAFNGSDIGIIGSFDKRYKGANIATLTKNYRCSGNILAVAENVIKNNERLFPKKLEVMVSGDFPKPQLKVYADQREQADAIATEIARVGHYGQTAIIYRGNSSGNIIEAALKLHGIPCERKGGKSFFEAKEIASFFSIFDTLSGGVSLSSFLSPAMLGGINPAEAHLVHSALLAYGSGNIAAGILAPNTSIGDTWMQKVSNTQLGKASHVYDRKKMHLPESIRANSTHPMFGCSGIGGKTAEYMGDFFQLSSKIKKGMTPLAKCDAILSSTFHKNLLRSYVSNYSRDNSGAIHEPTLINNLEKINKKMEIIRAIASKKKSDLAFLSELKKPAKEEEENEDKVQLLTVHASKGLEYKRVYLVDLSEGQFPNTRLMSGGGGVDEERRLFYVATTRAKEELMLSFAIKTGKSSAVKSRFLVEAGSTIRGND